MRGQNTTILLALLLFTCGYITVQALPTLNSASRPQSPLIDIQCDDELGRTTWDIVRSCLTTVFACVWVAIHIDVPKQDKRHLKFLATDGRWVSPTIRRAQSMLLALIAPEVLVSWAFRQWQEAKRLQKRHRKVSPNWPLSAGFFTVMGGFVDRDGQTILSEDFGVTDDDDAIIKSPIIICENHTPETDSFRPGIIICGREIDDKDKGDIVVKCPAVVQTSPFPTQCTARGPLRLAITELEIVTAAYAILNFATYWFWWSKPFDVRCPIHTGVPSEQTHPVTVTSVAQLPATATSAAPPSAATTIAERIATTITNQLLFLDLLACMTFGSRRVKPSRAGEVPRWYAGNPTPKRVQQAAYVAALAGICFGLVHCMGWHAVSPTPLEQILWQVSSAATTGLPCALSLFYLFKVGPILDRAVNTDPAADTNNVNQTAKYLLKITYHLISALYILARLSLLVMPFVSLRHLPHDAHCSVGNFFILHI